jgi:hypothetical protein
MTCIDSAPAGPAVRPSQHRWAAVACGIVAAAAWLAVATPATASLGAQKASKGLGSPRYQANSCDTAAVPAARAGKAAAIPPYSPELATQAGMRPAVRVSAGTSLLQYQLRNAIPHRPHSHSDAFQATEAANASGSCSGIASPIASTTFETTVPQDGRRLLQIAVAFAIAYVVFLTAWFWGTRERRSRVGRAARS